MDILYEDNHLLIVNKKAGQLSQGDKTSDQAIADHYKTYLKEKYNKPGNVFLHPTHRLDRPVSGCLILARTSKSLSRMTMAFRDGQVEKHYLALSSKKSDLQCGRLENYLQKDGKKNLVKVLPHPSAIGLHPSAIGLPTSLLIGKYAELEYEWVPPPSPLKRGTREVHMYHVRPKTGRSHQIRVQLSHAGMPIIGDLKYGGEKWALHKAIALHCYAMKFTHPTKKETILVQCLPNKELHWLKFMDSLPQIG